MRTRGFALDTAANALGTLIAAAVIYLVGVIAGVFTFQLFVAVLAPAGGAAATVLGLIQEAADIALAPAVGADR